MIQVTLAADVAQDRIDDVALEAGLQLVDLLPGTAAHPAQRIYLGPDRETSVHLIDGALPGARLLLLQGPRQSALAGDLRARLGDDAERAVSEAW